MLKSSGGKIHLKLANLILPSLIKDGGTEDRSHESNKILNHYINLTNPANDNNEVNERQEVEQSGLMNILLLGQTGIGKSTFINAFANYMKYATLEEATQNETDVLIKSKIEGLFPDVVQSSLPYCYIFRFLLSNFQSNTAKDINIPGLLHFF